MRGAMIPCVSTRARPGRDDSSDYFEQRTLTAAIRPDKCHRLAVANRQIDMSESIEKLGAFRTALNQLDQAFLDRHT